MRAIIALLIAFIIWGAGAPIFKYALGDIPPYTLAFIRFFLASFIFLPLAWHKKNVITPHLWWHITLGAFWGIAISVGLFYMGLRLAPSINSTVVGAIGPILLYFLSLRILHEKAHPQIIRGMLISLAGVCLIIFAPLIISPDSQLVVSQHSGLSVFIGNLFFLGATFGGIMMVVYNKKLSGKVHPYTFTSLQFFIGSLFFIPFMIPELHNWSFAELNERSWVGIIYGVFFSSALAYFAHNYALTKMSAQETGIFSYIMPIASVAVAIPLLGEFPDIFFIVGAVLICIGIVFAERHPHMKKIREKIKHHHHHHS